MSIFCLFCFLLLFIQIILGELNKCLFVPSQVEKQGQTKKTISCKLLNQWASLDYLQECGYLKAADHQNALQSKGNGAWKLHL